MPTFQTYHVTPTLPAALEPLREMSFNLWWTWEPSARRLFRHLDPELWNRTNHNPVRMLQLSRQSRLEELSQDKTFFRRIWFSRVNSKLFRRSRHSGQRPLQIGERPRSKLRGDRAALSPWLLQA